MGPRAERSTALVSAELAESTWRRVGTLGPAAIRALQERCDDFQPELCGFVTAVVYEMGEKPSALVSYVTLVLCEMFRAAPVRSFKKVGERGILKAWDASQDAVAELAERDPGELDAAVFAGLTDEPHALRYVIQALIEDDDEGDGVELSEEQFWEAFAVLKAVIDLLHGACKR
jgi:hypothetical protein